MGRVGFAAKNIAFGYIGNLSSTVLGFVLRTVFIMRLDATLLGVNGLYSGVLTMLSLAELGIGTALNYSLYAPVANKDYETIKSYLQYYKKAYRIIAGVVTGLGILLIPFLKYFIKNPGNYGMEELTVYYLIFLFNTVSTYFVAYKYSLVNAQQKNYIQTNVLTITKIATTLIQIVVLLTTSSFLLYLLSAAAVELVQKIYVSHYLNRRYPYLTDKDVTPLGKKERQDVIAKTKALVFHKVGDAARLQTDSIVISGFIQVAVVGMVDNYTMVMNSVSGFVNIIFNSVISGFGNLIATESKEKQYEIFRIYRFVANWIYGLSAIGFYVLLTPLIVLLWGEEWALGSGVIGLILIDYYFKGDRIVLSNFKTAAGVFEQDKYLALIQGGVNLVISIVLVQYIGLAGVYIGTIVSGLIANVTKPFIIYRVCFGRDTKEYFLDMGKHLLVTGVILGMVLSVSKVMLREITIVSFIAVGAVIVAVYNGVLLAVFGRTREFGYLWGIAKKKVMGMRGSIVGADSGIRVSEMLYLGFVVLMCFGKGIGLYDGQLIYNLIFVAAMACVAGKVLFTEYTVREWVGIVLLGILTLVMFRSSREKGVLICYALLVGMKGVSLKRIMQAGAWTYGITLWGMSLYSGVFLPYTDFSTNTRFGIENLERYTFGYPHANTFHATYLALCGLLIYSLGKKYNWKHMMLFMAGNAYLFLYSASTTGVITTTLLILLCWYCVQRKDLFAVEYGLGVLALPCILIYSVLAPFLLPQSLLDWLKANVYTFYHRLELAAMYVNRDNVTLFGKRAADVVLGNYSIDNSFLYSLVFNGILFTVLILIAYFILMVWMAKRKMKLELVITCVFLVQAIMEPFLFNTSFKNITLFFLGSMIWEWDKGSKGYAFLKELPALTETKWNRISGACTHWWRQSKGRILKGGLGIGIAVAAVCVFVLPQMFSYKETVETAALAVVTYIRDICRFTFVAISTTAAVGAVITAILYSNRERAGHEQ